MASLEGICRIRPPGLFDVCIKSEEMALISKDFFVSSNSGKDNPHFTSYIGCPAVHRNTECPLLSSLQLFISQPWIGWIRNQSFELLPELDSDFFGQIIQSFQNGIGNDDISRQSAFEPLL